MSDSRHIPPRVRSYSITHPPGRVALPTQPGWDYLVFAHLGLFTAITEAQAWTIPTHTALCVPDGTHVRIETARRTAIRCLYVDERLDALGEDVRVVNLTTLTRELLGHAISMAPMNLEVPADRATITLLADRLASTVNAPLHLPLPVDAVARAVASSIMADPGGGSGRFASSCRRQSENDREALQVRDTHEPWPVASTGPRTRCRGSALPRRQRDASRRHRRLFLPQFLRRSVSIRAWLSTPTIHADLDIAER
jgi:hypothetical protein